MKIIGTAKFKEICLSVLEKLGLKRIIITKHDIPITQVIPIEHENELLVGTMKSTLKVNGNISNTGTKWNAES